MRLAMYIHVAVKLIQLVISSSLVFIAHADDSTELVENSSLGCCKYFLILIRHYIHVSAAYNRTESIRDL